MAVEAASGLHSAQRHSEATVFWSGDRGLRISSEGFELRLRVFRLNPDNIRPVQLCKPFNEMPSSKEASNKSCLGGNQEAEMKQGYTHIRVDATLGTHWRAQPRGLRAKTEGPRQGGAAPHACACAGREAAVLRRGGGHAPRGVEDEARQGAAGLEEHLAGAPPRSRLPHPLCRARRGSHAHVDCSTAASA